MQWLGSAAGKVSTAGGGGGSAFVWMMTFRGGMLGLTIGGGGDADYDAYAGPSITTDHGRRKNATKVLVHAVGVSIPLDWRITIIFRGSVTRAGFCRGFVH